MIGMMVSAQRCVRLARQAGCVITAQSRQGSLNQQNTKVDE